MLNKPSPADPKNEIKTLQILRAVAATSVVYFHIGASPHFGSFGVDIFFVISGFVMAMIVANGQTPRDFAVHRICRIVPLYWLLTTCILLVAAARPELLNSTTANLQNYLKSILFIPYFKENGALQPMLALGWTLNYEMFFYLCIWLSILIARRQFHWITFGLLTATYLALGRMVDDQVANSFFGNELIFEFIFGLFAFKAHQSGYLEDAPKALMLGIVLLSCGFMSFSEVHGLEINRLLLYGVPSLALVYAAVSLEKQINFVHNYFARMFVNIGNASFSTYLSHFYVVEGTRKILCDELHLFDLYTPWGVMIALFMAVAVGQLLYEFIDRPLSRFCRSRLAAQ